MEEVKTAKSGIKYIEPADLKIGLRSYSQALLQRIPHNDPNKVDISLKIGRYNNLSGRPDTDNPRSELTLTNEELNALIQYISQNYKAVEMNAEQFIFVENQVDARIIDKFKALVGNQSETANFLIENSILTDNVYFAASAIEAIEEARGRFLCLKIINCKELVQHYCCTSGKPQRGARAFAIYLKTGPASAPPATPFSHMATITYLGCSAG